MTTSLAHSSGDSFWHDVLTVVYAHHGLILVGVVVILAIVAALVLAIGVTISIDVPAGSAGSADSGARVLAPRRFDSSEG